MHEQTYRHTQNFKTESSTRANVTIFLLVILGRISLEAGGILFPESSLQNQICWESANHNRRHQTSGASGYTYWSLQGSGKNFFFFFFGLCRLAQLSADITHAFLWSVSSQKLNKPDEAVFCLKVTEQTSAWMVFLFKDENRITNLLHLICTFL